MLFAQQVAAPEVVVPDWVLTLPSINACLNGLATILLLWGFVAIKKGQKETHKKLMLTAFGVSAAFLACYLLYHGALQSYTGSGSQKFTGEGIIRPIYFFILITHIILAVVVAVIVPWTIVLGLKQRWEKHRKMAKITFPIWFYVSITGVVIYFMLYHMG